MTEFQGIPFRPPSKSDELALTKVERGLKDRALKLYREIYEEAKVQEPVLVLCDAGNKYGVLPGDHYILGFGMRGRDYLERFGTIRQGEKNPSITGNDAIMLRILIKLRLVYFYHDCYKDAVFITDYGRNDRSDDAFYQRMTDLMNYQLAEDEEPAYKTNYTLNMIHRLSVPVAVIGFCKRGKELRDAAFDGDKTWRV